jgi:hypothetical protein
MPYLATVTILLAQKDKTRVNEILGFSCFDEQSTLIVSDILQKSETLRSKKLVNFLCCSG